MICGSRPLPMVPPDTATEIAKAVKSMAFATLFAFVLAPSYGFAQAPKVSDEELIKLSLSAAPEAVAKDRTDSWPSSTSKDFRKRPTSTNSRTPERWL
jgi:hypothetical protein